MDINALLAGEQRALLRARFGRPDRSGHEAAQAGLFASRLTVSAYPHRCSQHLLRLHPERTEL